MLRGTQRLPVRVLPDVAAECSSPGADENENHNSADLSFSSPRTVYQFENVEIAASQGCVRRDGAEQNLRQQAFHVLVYLLEHRERLVTKQELMNAIWQDTAVTDNALVQCITEIRKALGDDSRQPRFVRTIPRVGYRFIAAATESMAPVHVVARPGDPMELENGSTAGTGVQERGISWIRARTRPLAGGLIVILLLSGIALFRRSSMQRAEVALPKVPGRKPVAVMYFENQSQRRDLNWLREGLADMFITDLARSDKLTVLSRQQLHLLLGRIGHDSGGEIRLNDALEIARRSRAEAVIQGSFLAFGANIVVNVQLYDAGGQLLGADRIVAVRPDDILGQVDRVSLNLVSRLGRGLTDGAAKTRLAEAMTNNLEAYRYYSLGVSKAQSFQNAEAVAMLKKAIALDPKFAMAWARIGYAYSVTDFLPDKGRPFLEQAFHLSDRLTEKDRLYTRGWYAISREDYPGAIGIFRQIIDEYPLETEAYNNLGLLLYGEERADEAIAVLRQGLAVDGESKDLYNALGLCLSGSGRSAEAIAADRRYVELVPKEPNAHDSLGMSLERAGRYDEALSEYSAAVSLDPKFEPAIIHLGDVYSEQGRYRDAVREYLHYIQVTQSDAARAVGYGSIAQVYWRKRDMVRGEEAARNEMRYQKDAVWNSLLFAINRKDTATAAALKEKLFGDFPYPVRGVRHEQRSFDYFRGTLALRSGKTSEAIGSFQEALKHLPPSSGLDKYDDCLASAYLASGDTEDAIKEYQRILRLNPAYPLADYHLAKAYELKHDSAGARAAYELFLQTWNRADADIPEVIEAKAKLADGKRP